MPTIEGEMIVFAQNGKTFRLAQMGDACAPWKVVEAKGRNSWDSPNKSCHQIQFTVPAPKAGTARLAVRFSID